MAGVKEAGSAFVGMKAGGARAKVFSHGGSQAVRLPKAFRFEGTEVAISKEGDRVILEPIQERVWPKTDEEWKVFWAKIDEMRGPELIPYPPRDDIYFSDPE